MIKMDFLIAENSRRRSEKKTAQREIDAINAIKESAAQEEWETSSVNIEVHPYLFLTDTSLHCTKISTSTILTDHHSYKTNGSTKFI